MSAHQGTGSNTSAAVRLLVCAFGVLGAIDAVKASTGDRDFAFRQCTSFCETTGCIQLQVGKQLIRSGCDAACPGPNRKPVPLHLMLTQWTCHDDCRYRCMDLRKLYTLDHQDGSMCKYFGKWPFKRVLGVQELLSVIFSLANLAAHAHNIRRLHTAHLTNQHQPSFGSSQGPVWGLWYTYALGSINAWWWSAVFHSRDTYVTERLDYLSADVSIVIGLYVSIVRVLGVSSVQSRLAWAVPLAFATVVHFHYMLFIKFDYGFNVILCVLVGVLQQAMWCTWALMKSHPCKQHLVAFVVLINAALSLEILDFPPIIGFLDAHALWHLCTIPLIYLWYCFILADAKWATASAAHLTTADKKR